MKGICAVRFNERKSAHRKLRIVKQKKTPAADWPRPGLLPGPNGLGSRLIIIDLREVGRCRQDRQDRRWGRDRRGRR
jgi:hypothetical protein